LANLPLDASQNILDFTFGHDPNLQVNNSDYIYFKTCIVNYSGYFRTLLGMSRSVVLQCAFVDYRNVVEVFDLDAPVIPNLANLRGARPQNVILLAV
jgi:hypothetical protein